MLACQPEPRNTRARAHVLSSDELMIHEEAARLALAKASSVLYTSTYNTDFRKDTKSNAVACG